MLKCSEMPYHIALELRIYPSSMQKRMVAVKRLLSHREDTRIGTITVRRDSCGEYHVSLQALTGGPPLPPRGEEVSLLYPDKVATLFVKQSNVSHGRAASS